MNKQPVDIKGYEHPKEINNSNNTPQYMAYSNSNYISQNYTTYSIVDSAIPEPDDFKNDYSLNRTENYRNKGQ